MSELGRLAKLAVEWASGEMDRGEIVRGLEREASADEVRAGFRYWARHVARDAVSAWRKPSGASPRAPALSPGQTAFGWLTLPTPVAVTATLAYRHKYSGVLRRIAMLDRIDAVVLPWIASHDVANELYEETCRAAGVAEEDIAALAA